MKILRSDQQRLSRYVQGGTTTVFNQGRRLGWWERKLFTTSSTDIEFTITPKYQYRPDILAYDLYGDSELQWFIMQYNNVIDLYSDFITGNVITLPTESRLRTELLSKSL